MYPFGGYPFPVSRPGYGYGPPLPGQPGYMYSPAAMQGVIPPGPAPGALHPQALPQQTVPNPPGPPPAGPPGSVPAEQSPPPVPQQHASGAAVLTPAPGFQSPPGIFATTEQQAAGFLEV